MEIRPNSKCVKIGLPNGKVVDVLSPVLDEICKWIQNDCSKPESGGYIVGYQHEHTGNVSLEAVSHPYLMDIKNRVRFDIRDPRHQLFLKKARRHKSFYMGVWHTSSSSLSHDANEPHKTTAARAKNINFFIFYFSFFKLFDECKGIAR